MLFGVDHDVDKDQLVFNRQRLSQHIIEFSRIGYLKATMTVRLNQLEKIRPRTPGNRSGVGLGKRTLQV